jgi:phosphoserine phosphatase RsbU/P
MAVVEEGMRVELQDRRRRLEAAIGSGVEGERLQALLRDVDSALQRIENGTFGICEVCNEPVEADRLVADPLTRACIDHLTPDEQRALQQDLDLAARIQAVLLPNPQGSTPGWEVDFHYEPAGYVGGDYCDVVTGRDGSFLFALGDVSGKGVAASMLMAGLRATVRTLAETDLPPGPLVERANRLFCESALPQNYATLVCGRATASGEVVICNAGHPAPLLRRGGEILSIAATGIPIGLFCRGDFAVSTVKMEPGDALLLFSDGVDETRDRAGSEYGMERLGRVLNRGGGLDARGIVRACLEDLNAFGAGGRRSDDLTLMAIRRAPGRPQDS